MPRLPVAKRAMRSATSFASVPLQLRMTLSISRAVQRGEAFAEVDDGFVQVAAVDVQRRLLARHRLDHARVGVTDAGDVVVHVDVAAAVGVVEVARPRRARCAAGARRTAARRRRARGCGGRAGWWCRSCALRGRGCGLREAGVYDAAAALRHGGATADVPTTNDVVPKAGAQALHHGPSERTMSTDAIKSRSRRQGERMPWTSDCKASMRS